MFIFLAVSLCFVPEAFGFRLEDGVKTVTVRGDEVEINCIRIMEWTSDSLDRSMQENGFQIGDCLCGFDNKVYRTDDYRNINIMKGNLRDDVIERWRNGQAIKIIVERNGRYFELILMK